jgi:hypothetical protein
MQRLFLAEAEKYNVLPLDDRRVERPVPTLAGPPFHHVGSHFGDALSRHERDDGKRDAGYQ